MIEMARAAGPHGGRRPGSDVTDHPEVYLGAGADYAAVGEARPHGGRALARQRPEAPPRRHGGPGRPTSPGWCTASSADRPTAGTAAPHAAGPPNERHPDVFPFPAWDLVDVERYRRPGRRHHGYFSVEHGHHPRAARSTATGAPSRSGASATPCARPPTWPRSWPWSSARCAPDHIWFADDIFGLRPQLGGRVRPRGGARDAAHPLHDPVARRPDDRPKRWQALASAGCAEVWLGAESGSQRILDAMDKGTKVEQIAAARARLGAPASGPASSSSSATRARPGRHPGHRRAGAGDPARRHRRQRQLPAARHPLPRHGARSSSAAKTNWVDSDDLAMMFQGTYQIAFYRQLHRLLHRDLDLRRRLASGRPPGRRGPAGPRRAGREQWFELGQLEATSRSPAPTSVREPYGLDPGPRPEPGVELSRHARHPPDPRLLPRRRTRKSSRS